VLKRAVDSTKDQSYVLYHLGQKELPQLLFPLGAYTKVEIREMARKFGLKTADKPDSQEICFVPNQDYKQFIEEEVPVEQRRPGPIRHKDGRILGEHRGLPFYTVGQREGLGLAVGHPLYVAKLEMATNTLVVGDKKDVFADTMTVREVVWSLGVPPSFPLTASVKIRYKHAEAKAVLDRVPSPLAGEGGRRPHEGGNVSRIPSPQPYPAGGEGDVQVVFREPQSAVTPGQAAVFYDGDVVLGGGVIDRAS
jgi:tRNA-specific 2-thiouridylase